MMKIITLVLRFLWVAFQIEDLCRQKSDAEIRHTLKTLPKDLPETYQRALSRVIKDGNQKLATRYFDGWRQRNAHFDSRSSEKR
jgi:hypothetical protein